MIKQDSAKFWFPKLAAHPWQWMKDWLPNTILIDYSEEALAASLHGEHTAEYDRLYYAVEAAIRYEIVGPAFIRTDITSAKHLGETAFSVKTEDDLNTALLKTLGHASLKTYFSPVRSSAIMVRPLLDLKGDRTAFGGLRIGNELRVFASQDGVQCWHYYWPTEALIDHMDDKQPPANPWPSTWIRTDVRDAAALAAKTTGAGKWSIDFAEDRNGKFWLLDMASAGNSFHVPECKHAEADEENKL